MNSRLFMAIGLFYSLGCMATQPAPLPCGADLLVWNDLFQDPPVEFFLSEEERQKFTEGSLRERSDYLVYLVGRSQYTASEVTRSFETLGKQISDLETVISNIQQKRSRTAQDNQRLHDVWMKHKKLTLAIQSVGEQYTVEQLRLAVFRKGLFYLDAVLSAYTVLEADWPKRVAQLRKNFPGVAAWEKFALNERTPANIINALLTSENLDEMKLEQRQMLIQIRIVAGQFGARNLLNEVKFLTEKITLAGIKVMAAHLENSPYHSGMRAYPIDDIDFKVLVGSVARSRAQRGLETLMDDQINPLRREDRKVMGSPAPKSADEEN